MNFKQFGTQVPSEFQELTAIANSGTQYIDTGLKGSDLADCELEIVMKNSTTSTTAYNFNGAYLSGSTAQFGLVATSSSECRSSINFGFNDAISTTGLDISEFHTIYATNGLQKVDNTVVGTLNFGTLNDGKFLLFARTGPNQASGINICVAMSLKSFTVKRDNQYIRNMIPVRRKSDSQLGLYDLANDVFYTNQGTGNFTGGTVVEPTWTNIPHYIMGTSTDTITTLPADIYANNTTATVGLKGQMVQSSTPTPTDPIQPQECGERTAQLINPAMVYNKSLDTITGRYYYNEGGDRKTAFIYVESNTEYTFSIGDQITDRLAIVGYNRIVYPESAGVLTLSCDDIIFSQTTPFTGSCTFTTGANTKMVAIYYSNTAVIANPMLNIGSTALPYEPYGQYKIPILSNSQTTNVYLGEVESTRRIKKLVLTGEETWGYTTASYGYCYDLANSTTFQINNSFCSHFKNSGYTGNSRSTGRESLGNGEFICIRTFPNIYFRYDSVSNMDEFKAYLQQQYAAGTPVTIWYVLTTEETGIVNEPIRKIGTYADEVSGVSIPVTAGANTLSIGTTVQPSEVSATYKGWHPVQSVHERENGAWD